MQSCWLSLLRLAQELDEIYKELESGYKKLAPLTTKLEMDAMDSAGIARPMHVASGCLEGPVKSETIALISLKLDFAKIRDMVSKPCLDITCVVHPLC